LSWSRDSRATSVARAVFPEAPVVDRFADGEQWRITPTGHREALGCMYLVRVQRNKFVAAAERLPEGSLPDRRLSERLSSRLEGHLKKNGLIPWRLVSGDDVTDAIRELGAALAHARRERAASRSPFVCPLEFGAAVTGKERERLAIRLSCVLSARHKGNPVPALVGVEGVGRRTVAMAAARARGLGAVELPLGRLIVDGKLNAQAFFETMLTAVDGLDQNLLVVSGVEILQRVHRLTQLSLIREIARLLTVVLLTEPQGRPLVGVIPLTCRGLSGPEELDALLKAELPEADFLVAAVQTLARWTTADDFGVVPARALLGARLCLRLLDADDADAPPAFKITADGVCPAVAEPGADVSDVEGRARRIGADEIIRAIRILEPAWHEPDVEAND
jgi:hypothetical protein